eukprot:UN22817
MIMDLLQFIVMLLIVVPLWIVYLIPLAIYLGIKKLLCPKPKRAVYECENLDAKECSGPSDDRKYDLIVFGVTGFTGNFGVHYVAKAYGNTDLRWAIGGRSRSKLEKIKSELESKYKLKKPVDIVVADSLNVQQIESMVQQTLSIATFVGPFQKYGSVLVRACAKYGTHYADSTGESAWMRQMIGMYHQQAIK